LGESPRWLFRRGRRDDAYRALLRTCDVEKADAAMAAMAAVGDDVVSLAASGAKRETLLQRRYVYPFILACTILACTQLTGANSIIGYNTTILLQSGLDDVQAHWGYVLFNTCGCLATIIALLLVDRKGRTFLLSLGTAGIMAALFSVGILFYRIETQQIDCREQVQLFVTAEQTCELRFDQAMSDRLLANSVTLGQPTTLMIIHSYGGFRTATSVVRSDDALAKPIIISRTKSLPKSAVNAFLSNPFADLVAAQTAPLKIENAMVTPVPNVTNGWLTAICLCVFKAFFAIGPGVCVWLALSELMPTRIRSMGMSIALLINNVISATIAAVFLPTVGHYGYSTIFFIFAGFTAIYFMVARFILPETKGRTLEEIEQEFAGKKAAD
jgi:hypothetical protein